MNIELAEETCLKPVTFLQVHNGALKSSVIQEEIDFPEEMPPSLIELEDEDGGADVVCLYVSRTKLPQTSYTHLPHYTTLLQTLRIRSAGTF